MNTRCLHVGTDIDSGTPIPSTPIPTPFAPPPDALVCTVRASLVTSEEGGQAGVHTESSREVNGGASERRPEGGSPTDGPVQTPCGQQWR